MPPSLSRDTAHRIALAAETMTEVSIARLLDLLLSRLGPPLDLEKLTKITAKDLRSGLVGAPDGRRNQREKLADESYQQAAKILQGNAEAEDTNAPSCEKYSEGEFPDSLRVAVASNTGEVMDGHFGSCHRFLIYQVSQTKLRLISVRSTYKLREGVEKSEAKAALLKDCQLLFIASIGGPAAAKVVKLNIYPIKREAGQSARELVSSLQPILSRPPPWLAKHLGTQAEERVRIYDATGSD